MQSSHGLKVVIYTLVALTIGLAVALGFLLFYYRRLTGRFTDVDAKYKVTELQNAECVQNYTEQKEINEELAQSNESLREERATLIANREFAQDLLADKLSLLERAEDQVLEHSLEIKSLAESKEVIQRQADDYKAKLEARDDMLSRMKLQLDQATQEYQRARSEFEATRRREEHGKVALKEAETLLQSRANQLVEEKELHEETKQSHEELSIENDKLRDQVETLKLLNTQLQAEKVALENQADFTLDQGKKLESTFAALSEKFLKARQEDLEKTNANGLMQVVEPLKDAFASFQKRSDDIHLANIRGQAALKNELEHLKQKSSELGKNAENLSQALRRDKKKLGNWGELQLERLLENSGLGKECYRREVNFKTDDGRDQRPDFVIDLPDNKHLIIDSKVTLNAYVDAVNATNDGEALESMNKHVAHIKAHVDSLARKGYDNLGGVNVPDFIFMFMPNEAAFLAAFEHAPDLFNYAYERKIAVVTPTTLMPVLGTVSSLWRLDQQNQSTEALALSAERVHDKLRVFLEHFKRVGHQLDMARNTFDSAQASLMGRGSLIGNVDKFKELGVKVRKKLPELE